MSKQPIISFQNYSFQYKSQSKPTLHDITLDIYPGEKIWIAGPSGSGKSTLAHCMNGLIPFTYAGTVTGQLRIADKDPATQSIFAISDHVGTILQDQDAQFVGLTVGEDVAFAMENKGVPREAMKSKVIASLQMVEMLEKIGSSPYELSGGQKQRVSLAGILSTDAKVLLFDEPLANLDPVSSRRAMQLIDEIHRESGKTVILIEHRGEDVLIEPLDRIVIMNEGRIVQVGTPDEILAGDFLRHYGLRPPLYVDALKKAGISLQGVTGLAAPRTLPITGLRERLEVWMDDHPPTSTETHPKEELLRLRDICFGYEATNPVIRHVSLEIAKGEIVALLGNNGAGKSTLSQIITGMLRPQSGTLLFQGEDMADWSIKRRGEHIGYVMQNPNLMITQHLLFDEVALGLRARGVATGEIKERVEQVLQICGLYRYRNWPVKALSYGQKKRLTIAAILILHPELIILDEPTAGQDYQHYREFMNFIERLAIAGTAFLFITHDMYLALEYAERAVVLHDGEVIASDRVGAILGSAEITERAHLTETSLSVFARANGLPDPQKMVEAYIDHEKRRRGV